EATLDRRYLEFAKVLAGVMLERFEDHEDGGFFFTSDDHESLITRSKAAFDGSTPSGNSAAVMALLRLYAYTSDESYMKAADLTLCLFAPQIEKQPFAFAHMIEAADLYERGPTEIAFIGDRGADEFAAWLKQLGRLYVANLALYVADPSDDATILPEALQGKRQVAGRLTAYLCRDRACSAPITEFAELERALGNPH
ncbi:MAG TPA: hypothetical protein VKB78_11165, partial [Pirellulales bacterium]|nr:hypothetical protein [Pirellulales bacterium]